jgi:hypothetical protein
MGRQALIGYDLNVHTGVAFRMSAAGEKPVEAAGRVWDRASAPLLAALGWIVLKNPALGLALARA